MTPVQGTLVLCQRVEWGKVKVMRNKTRGKPSRLPRFPLPRFRQTALRRNGVHLYLDGHFVFLFDLLFCKLTADKQLVVQHPAKYPCTCACACMRQCVRAAGECTIQQQSMCNPFRAQASRASAGIGARPVVRMPRVLKKLGKLCDASPIVRSTLLLP